MQELSYAEACVARYCVANRLLNEWRDHWTSSTARSVSFCWTPTRISTSLGRTPQPLSTAGSQWVVALVGPSGALSPPHSPLPAALARLQSGRKLPLASLHTRKALRTRVLIGLLAVAVAV